MAKDYAEGKKKSYVEHKKAKKKSASGAAWILVLLALIFIFVLVKFARNAGLDFISNSTGLPSGDDAYTVAKDFVKSSVRANSIDFPGSGYQMGKKTDSIFVIRTQVELTGDSGDKRKTSYKLVMQYKGGKQDETKNWLLLNIVEQ